MDINWSVCRGRGCEYYQNGFAGTECLKGLSYEQIILCQNDNKVFNIINQKLER